MIRHRFMLIGLLIIMFAVFLPGTLKAQKAKQQQLEFPVISKTAYGVKIALPDMLTTYGEAYDCFFTIEQACVDGEVFNKFESTLIERPSTKHYFRGDIQDALEELRQLVPNFAYVINKDNPRIIHIMDDRLSKQTNYGLDQIIGTIDFKGTMQDLIGDLSSKGIHISLPRMLFNNEHLDRKTKVRVHGDGLQVRDALSNFVKLKGRYRILWVSRTKLAEQATTQVLF